MSGTDKSQTTLTTSQKPTDGKISGPVVYTNADDSAPKFTLTVTDYEIVEDQTAQWNAAVEGETYPLDVNGDTSIRGPARSRLLSGRHHRHRRDNHHHADTPSTRTVTVESGDKLGQLNRIRHRRLQAGRRRDEEHSGIRRNTAVRLHLGHPGDRGRHRNGTHQG